MGPDFLGLGPHAGFILAAYGATFATLAGLIVWVVADHRTVKNQLADFERRGIVRRADRSAP